MKAKGYAMAVFRSAISLLALSSGFISAQVFAGECKGKFCVGGWVIDSGGSVGVLVGFPGETTGRYRIGTSDYDASLGRLSVEVSELNGVKPQGKLIDAGNSVGVALHVFEDGRVQYQIGSSSYVTRSASPEVAEVNSVRKGTVIIDAGNSVGTALAVFANQKVLYQVGGSAYVTSSAVAEVAEVNGLKAGNYAIDAGNSVGRLIHVFRDGRAQYRVGSSDYISSRMSPEVASMGRLRAGVPMIDAGNSIGTTLRVFSDGRVLYQVGSSAYVTGNAVASVESLNGLRAGVVAIDAGDSIGVIQTVFADGRASYRIGASVYVSSRLSREVDSHPAYQKGMTYATSSYDVGKAIRFFENRKVQLELLNGGTTVAKDLLAATDEVEGYKAGSTLVDAEENLAIAKMVFANGAVVYELQNPADENGKGKLFSGKVYALFQEKDTEKLALLKASEERDWIWTIVRALAKREKIPAWIPMESSYLLVTQPEHLPEIRKALLERVFEEPELIENKELRKKVREHLSQPSA